jgi:hypothetical protein
MLVTRSQLEVEYTQENNEVLAYQVAENVVIGERKAEADSEM